MEIKDMTATEDELIDALARNILEIYREAFEELAK